MSFQPFTLGSGLAGWSLLKSTLKTQVSTYKNNYLIQSDTKYFKEQFKNLNSPEDIVSDRRILRVVLGAYGLSDDIENRHFIKTAMSEGVSDRSALANKLSDRRYRLLAEEFDFSKATPAHKTISGLAERTVKNYLTQSFEVEIGKSNNDMRLALGFGRSLQQVAQESSSNSTAWYQILATPPLREVLQTALGLPKEFSQLDIDAQHSRIQGEASRVFGTDIVADLMQDGKVDEITRRFLVLRQSDSIEKSSSLQTALVLLSSIQKRPFD